MSGPCPVGGQLVDLAFLLDIPHPFLRKPFSESPQKRPRSLYFGVLAGIKGSGCAAYLLMVQIIPLCAHRGLLKGRPRRQNHPI